MAGTLRQQGEELPQHTQIDSDSTCRFAIQGYRPGESHGLPGEDNTCDSLESLGSDPHWSHVPPLYFNSGVVGGMHVGSGSFAHDELLNEPGFLALVLFW